MINTFTDLFWYLVGFIVAFRIGSSLGTLIEVIGGIVIGNCFSILWDSLLDDFANSQMFKDLTKFFGYDDEENKS